MEHERQKTIDYTKQKLRLLLKSFKFELDYWTIDLEEMQDEGHGYLFNNMHLHEMSGVTLTNSKDKKNIGLWLDYAFIADRMPEPVLFVETISPFSWREYFIQTGIDIIPPPNEYLKSLLGEQLFSKLLEQEYFGRGIYMKTWK